MFFDLTYPSEDLRGMLQALSRRFATRETEGNGLFLAEAVKGFGKSHALLTAYHLFAHPEPAKKWMANQGVDWAPPVNPVIIIKKFTDQYLPFDSLWTDLGKDLNVRWDPTHQPSLDELRAGLNKKNLILIFDELERGISNISDPAKKSQNLSFLQLLSEEANRSNQVTLFAAIYDGAIEPGSTLKRVPRIELRFRRPEDRAAIVRHRLFTNADSYDRTAAEVLIRSYVNTWARFGVNTQDDYFTKLKSSFPFLPGLIELIFERTSGTGGFQGTRGALGLLAAMLDASESGSFLFTAGNCLLSDSACADRLQDLDPSGSLINCAQRNFQDLKNQPLSEALASAVLLASIVPGTKGLTREELVRYIARPGCDPNQFESTLQAFRTYGSYFHEREGRFFFDLEENENAKVEIEAIRIGDERAREEIRNIWKTDLFKETQQAVIFSDLDTTRNALGQMSKTVLRFVLSPRRLSGPERYALYHGMELRNQIILLEPRDDAANHLNNPDILVAAKRSIAAATLAPTAATAERRNRYEKIASQEKSNVRDFLKAAGIEYIRVEEWGELHENSVFEIESLGQAWDKQSILDYIRRQIYPRAFFHEHIRENLSKFYGQTVTQVEHTYKNTLAFPVPTTYSEVMEAVITLVEDRNRILGLQHPRQNACGERVTLGAGEMPSAILAQPWPSISRQPVPEPAKPVIPVPPSQPVAGKPKLEPSVPAGFMETRGTSSCKTKGDLRQEIAAKVSDVDGKGIQDVQFQIFAKYEKASLADFPSALRGSLAESGTLDVQIELSIPGPMDKALSECLCESLPVFENGTYTARLRVISKPADKPQPPDEEEEA
ncbi:MAG: ATPase superfamily-like protein [Deltaproteobacteria bacterium]|nr:ATPase superfamily-like protein [Deltaproteobacteria bacterium]